jgi:hypothetical protein
MATVNPYMPPNAFVADVSTVDPQAEAIREEFIKHEASVRSIGIRYYVGGVLMVVAAAAMLLAGFGTQEVGAVFTVIAAVYGGFGVLAIAVGQGLRQLRTWARTAATVLSAIGLLGFPVGTLIHGYILYLLLSEQGRRIFESDYADIVAATPHIKYRTCALHQKRPPDLRLYARLAAL